MPEEDSPREPYPYPRFEGFDAIITKEEAEEAMARAEAEAHPLEAGLTAVDELFNNAEHIVADKLDEFLDGADAALDAVGDAIEDAVESALGASSSAAEAAELSRRMPQGGMPQR